MQAYKGLIQHILDNGTRYETNKGACIGVIGAQVVYDISNGLPIVTGKKTNILWAVAEYTMFLKGISNVDFLARYGAAKIWESQGLSKDITVETNRNPAEIVDEYSKLKGITDAEGDAYFKERVKEYLAKRQELDSNPPMLPEVPVDPNNPEAGMQPLQVDGAARAVKLKEFDDWLTQPFVEMGIVLKENKVIAKKGDLGPIYGTQWRGMRAIAPKGQQIVIDQLKDVVAKLSLNPESRQIIMTAWNPAAIAIEKYSYDEKIANGFMGQPPCHVNYHFLTRKNEAGEYVLNTTVWLRSNDVMVGHPFNAIGGALITHLIAKTLGFKVGSLTMQISDAHIYENHLEKVQQYLDADIHEQPAFVLPDNIDVFNFEVEDIMAGIGEYTHSGYIPFDLNVNDNALKESQAADENAATDETFALVGDAAAPATEGADSKVETTATETAPVVEAAAKDAEAQPEVQAEQPATEVAATETAEQSAPLVTEETPRIDPPVAPETAPVVEAAPVEQPAPVSENAAPAPAGNATLQDNVQQDQQQ